MTVKLYLILWRCKQPNPGLTADLLRHLGEQKAKPSAGLLAHA